jgi:hypothetical protein
MAYPDILARHAGYVMTVKANMPALYKQLKKLPWKAIPAVSSVSTDHGRRGHRSPRAIRFALRLVAQEGRHGVVEFCPPRGVVDGRDGPGAG